MCAAALFFNPAQRAWSANVETLLMPGKLSQPHAKFEESCANCHDKADRGRQTTLCLDCHKEIRADITAKRGLHGNISNVDKTACRACHTEHKRARCRHRAFHGQRLQSRYDQLSVEGRAHRRRLRILSSQERTVPQGRGWLHRLPQERRRSQEQFGHRVLDLSRIKRVVHGKVRSRDNGVCAA